MTRPTAAASIYPHLKSNEPPKQQQSAPSLASALYPSLSAEQRAWDAWRERDRQSLLKALREANAAADARLAQEGKR